MNILQSNLLALAFLFLTEIYFCQAQSTKILQYQNAKPSDSERVKDYDSTLYTNSKDIVFPAPSENRKLIEKAVQVKQLPMYYNYKSTALIDYVTIDSNPLFPRRLIC